MNIVIIGGGPGGYVAAIRAAQLGAEVTLIEKGNLGGVCLNVGCIPTKALLHSAELYENAKNSQSYGITADPVVDFAVVQQSRQRAVDQLVSGVGGLMAANKINVVNGEAKFEDAKTIVVETEKGRRTFKPDRTIIATGSVPAIPPLAGADLAACIDSTGALELDHVPESMVIIGGGVIGVEMASIYNSFGTETTILEMQPEILPMMDGQLTTMLRRELEADGIKINTGAKVTEIAKDPKGAMVYEEIDGKQQRFSCEKVLISVGRRPATESLNLAVTGVEQEKGKIKVNDRMQTSIPHIYAIGDCTGGIMLAHVASVHGEIAAEHIMGHSVSYDGATAPSCVYTTPEFAGVGLTEEQAKEQGIDYKVGTFSLAGNGKNIIVGGTGIIKIIAGSKYNEVLGMHILGPRATDLIVEGALAIGSECTIDEIIGTIHAHPTFGEAIREAALAVEKRAIHMPNR